MKKLKLFFIVFITMFIRVANAQMVLEYNIAIANTKIELPLNGTVNVEVDWGDGSPLENFTTVGFKPHIYTAIGVKTVTITGALTHYGIYFNALGNTSLSKVLSWEGLGLTSLSYAFLNETMLTNVPVSLPSTVTDLSYMFSNARIFNQPIGSWNTEAVTDMNRMFSGANVFNQPIGNWNTSSVTKMNGMFSTALAFNQPLSNWNTSTVTDMSNMFSFAYAFNQPIGNWNTSLVTNMARMFEYAKAFNQPIGDWNTSAVQDMSYMFTNANAFNQPIGNWSTSLVTSMRYMFSDASNFNKPIETWNTSVVTDMCGMFAATLEFNQPISNWNTSSVSNMSKMFYDAKAFNKPIGNWNTSTVQNVSEMFSGATAFNQPIGTWNTTSVTNMGRMFYKATAFNQPIGTWNTGAVTNMGEMFGYASAFNQPIGNWNTASVTQMGWMFMGATAFDHPIGNWNTAGVTNMSNMFSGASAFNQPIGNWNTGAVTNMSYMFDRAIVFNQPIGNWNTSAVMYMYNIFANAYAFNQSLGNWNITNVSDMPGMFLNVGLCTYNYDATLNGWSTQAVKSGVNFTGGNSTYSSLGVLARAMLISKGWVITDGGFGLTADARCEEVRYYNTIRGKIYTDANADCINQGTEKRLSSMVVKALPGPYYGFSDSNGNYEIRVDTGTVTYTLTQQFNAAHSTLLTNQCAPSHVVSLTGAFKDVASFNFANDVKSCILPSVNVSHAPLVRCFKSSAYLEYCNLGNAAMNNAVIKVEYPAHLIPISSVPMWTSKAGAILLYDIGTLQETTCGQIKIIDSVDCSSVSILGLTQCIKVSITPNSTCAEPSSLWDFSSTTVVGTCENNQAVFVLANNGEGHMADSLAYRIFVNDTLIYNGKYKLLSGSTFNVQYPAQAQTVRLEADQHPNHPGKSRPRATIEMCGISPTGFVAKGLVTTITPDDLDEEVSIVCYPIIGSYDPNDKQARPTGVGVTHQVAPGTEIEYTIRFQNTGTAMAYKVKIVDTLDINLDVASIIQGASSHPYILTITGKGQAVLTYTFNNINLPDSTSDKLGSNGLLSFKITIPDDITLGTVIDNKAYIYFDYNDPIITNYTMHTVGITTVQNLSKGSNVQVGSIVTGLLNSQYTNAAKIYPNPSEGKITIELAEVNSNTELRVTSIEGVTQKIIKLSNTARQEVNLEGLHQGMYLYEIWQDGQRSSVGKLHIR